MNKKPTPSWNSSTMCLQLLHRSMATQGWKAQQPATPLWDYGSPRLDYDLVPLPKRPLDFGVGLWR